MYLAYVYIRKRVGDINKQFFGQYTFNMNAI